MTAKSLILIFVFLCFIVVTPVFAEDQLVNFSNVNPVRNIATPDSTDMPLTMEPAIGETSTTVDTQLSDSKIPPGLPPMPPDYVGDPTPRENLKSKYMAKDRKLVSEDSLLLETNQVQLYPGWNMISVPLWLQDGENTGMAVFGGVNTDAHSIWTYNSATSTWVPLQASTIIAPLEWYYVYSHDSLVLNLVYDSNQPLPSKQLYGGVWNAVGIWGLQAYPARDTLSSVSSVWTTAQGYDAENQVYETTIILGGSGEHSDSRLMYPTKGYWLWCTGAGTLIPYVEIPVVANFTANVTSGPAPVTVEFNDTSSGSPTEWNWSFGDGNFSTMQNPVHTYENSGNYTVVLSAANNESSDNLTKTDYIQASVTQTDFNSSVIFSSMPTTMFAGEHYLVDIKVNNTGASTWYADNSSPNLVFLQGLGGSSGDAEMFNITHIPMIFQNETVAFNESYDFFFYVHAPDTIGNYSPAYQVSSASSGEFGEISNVTVRVIENPFHPVTFPNGTKLYTTTFGNTSSGISVDIVGPQVYIENARMSQSDDPRFLINPSVKGGIFDFELNESYSYANVSIGYDPGVAYPANLTLSYFNETTGNYTAISSAVDTVNHKVTAQVPHTSMPSVSSRLTVLDGNQYFALPVSSQNEMGYPDLGPNDNSTVGFFDPSPINTNVAFYGGRALPPGNYTILASGIYNDAWWLYQFYPDWTTYPGVKSADDDYGPNTWGMQVYFQGPPGGPNSARVSTLRVQSGVLKFTHYGGPIAMRNYAQGSATTGAAATYKLYYGDGPVFSDSEYGNITELNNDAFNATENGWDLAKVAYQAAAGCVLGQAGQKGGYLDGLHSAIPGWSDAINDDVTESPAYLVGHVACAIAFPEIALARDFTADVLRGDPMDIALDSLGYLGPVKNLIKSSGVLTGFMIRNPGSDVKLINGLYDLKMADGVSYVDKFSWYEEVSGGSASWLANNYGTTTEAMEKVYLGAKQPLERIKQFLETSATGNIAPKAGKTTAETLEKKWTDHINDPWISRPSDKNDYLQRGTTLLNKRDASVEIYYQKGYDTLVVYDRANREFVSGTINGDLVTFFPPNLKDGADIYVNGLVDEGRLIRLK